MIHETLYSLKEAGFVNIDKAKLDAYVVVGYKYTILPSFTITPTYALDEHGNPKHVGDCNVSDFLAYATGISVTAG